MKDAAKLVVSGGAGLAAGFLVGRASVPPFTDETIQTYYFLQLHPKIREFLQKVKVVVHGQTDFERTVDFGVYSHLFYAGYRPAYDTYLAKVGIEDRDAPNMDDGWTDIDLPIFWGIAPNQGGVAYPIIFVDTALSGNSAKDLWLYTQGAWRRVLYYSVATGMRFLSPTGPMTSVGYIEFDIENDTCYHPTGLYG